MLEKVKLILFGGIIMSAATEDWRRIQELERRVKALEHLTHGHHESIPSQRPVKLEPKLIQGYTAEQWQEIIDCGYLCEFRDKPGRWVCGLLASCSSDGENYYFIQDGIGGKKFCRPAQIKGAMRPIFVEPVDKEARCIAVADDGTVLYNGPWHNKLKYSTADRATKYIEL